MNTRHILSNVMRLVAAACCVATASGCGSELLRTGRAPAYLTIRSLRSPTAPTGNTGSLLSDCADAGRTTDRRRSREGADDLQRHGRSHHRRAAKNPNVPTSPINSVTITRYRITFKRIDGRNTPGVDVPFGWDGATSVTIPIGGTGDVGFEIVRHSSKPEPPLRNLVNNGGGSSSIRLRRSRSLAEIKMATKSRSLVVWMWRSLISAIHNENSATQDEHHHAHP